eukprot:jgi/Tetstr1/441204/TSEL_029460.t1
MQRDRPPLLPLLMLLLLMLMLMVAGAGAGAGAATLGERCPQLPAEAEASEASGSGLGGGCAKLIYLHIPKCGGSSVMAALAPLAKRGVRVVRYKGQVTYRNGHLADELAAEASEPLRWPRKVIEIHLNRGYRSYASLHKELTALRGKYETAGCRVALVGLVREPVSLARSWYTYCSKQWATGPGGKRRQRFMPARDSLLRACGRHDVMANFLAAGTFCRASDAQDNATLAELGAALGEFDLLDDIAEMPRWLAHVFRFLGDSKCFIPHTNVHAQGIPERQLRLDLRLPDEPKDNRVYCAWSTQLLSIVAKRSAAADGAALPQAELHHLTAGDQWLYNTLRPHFLSTSDSAAEARVPSATLLPQHE